MQRDVRPVSTAASRSSARQWFLTKHEGLGNDFLVLLDPADNLPVDGERARRACDRRRGIGADGLLHARPASEGTGIDAVMVLYNADGSRAEMSGNGIRCFAQALLVGGWAHGPKVVVETDAGIRTVSVVDGSPAGEAAAPTYSVEMGRVRVGDEAPDWALGPTVRAVWADAGNPHLVVEVPDVDTGAAVDLADLGERVNASVVGGTNVHVVAPGKAPDQVVIRIFERGVGPTEACGTGACAVAAVARGWGLASPGEDGAVEVAMPGGSAKVVPGDPALLIGPARPVAAVTWPWP